MSQEYLPIDKSVPAGDTGGTLADKLNNGRDALLTTHSGNTEPPYKKAGTPWLDTSATPWTLRMYDGADWIPLFQVNPATNLPVFASDATLASTVSTLSALVTAFNSSPQITGVLERPTAKSYVVVLKARFAFKITSVTTICGFGTATLTVTVDGVAIDGSANSVSTSEQSQAHDQSVSIGQDVAIVISGITNCLDLAFSIEITRS